MLVLPDIFSFSFPRKTWAISMSITLPEGKGRPTYPTRHLHISDMITCLTLYNNLTFFLSHYINWSCNCHSRGEAKTKVDSQNRLSRLYKNNQVEMATNIPWRLSGWAVGGKTKKKKNLRKINLAALPIFLTPGWAMNTADVREKNLNENHVNIFISLSLSPVMTTSACGWPSFSSTPQLLNFKLSSRCNSHNLMSVCSTMLSSLWCNLIEPQTLLSVNKLGGGRTLFFSFFPLFNGSLQQSFAAYKQGVVCTWKVSEIDTNTLSLLGIGSQTGLSEERERKREREREREKERELTNNNGEKESLEIPSSSPSSSSFSLQVRWEWREVKGRLKRKNKFEAPWTHVQCLMF